MDPEYMKECVDTQNRISAGSDGAHGLANRVRKAQLSVCCRFVGNYYFSKLHFHRQHIYFILFLCAIKHFNNAYLCRINGVESFSPVETFLTLMNSDVSCWPNKGSFKVWDHVKLSTFQSILLIIFYIFCDVKVVREIDDHADIIAVEMVSDCTPYGGKSANLVSFIFLLYFYWFNS